MARRTVKVSIPVKNPNEFSKLLNNIEKQDTLLGSNSSLKNDPDIDMTAFAAKVAQADAYRAESESLRQQSEAKMELANNLYGTSTGQTVNTPGTLYYEADIIKKSLLKSNKGQEEALSLYGFNVVIGQAKSPKSKK